MIYFVLSRAIGLVKIGQAKDPEARMQAMQTGSADFLELLGSIDRPDAFESVLHLYFADLHAHHEWFHFTGVVKEAIPSLLAGAFDESLLPQEGVKANHLQSWRAKAARPQASEPQPCPNAVIDALGGTSKVASLIEAPVSTVHSWRRIGIPPSRLAHLKLLAQVEGKELPPEMAA